MDADQVFSDLSGKISDLQSKLDQLQSKFDGLQSNFSDQKSTLDKVQAEEQQISSAVNDLKSSSAGSGQQTLTTSDQVFARLKAIEDANAAAERKALEQVGLLGQLTIKAQDTAKAVADAIVAIPDTATNIAKQIADKAFQDGKKEILGTFDGIRKDIIGSVSDVTTKAIKEAIKDAKTEILNSVKDEVLTFVLDDVKKIEADRASSSPTTSSSSTP